MARLFICFLGIGNPNSKPGEAGYLVAQYEMEGVSLFPTAFAQTAIIASSIEGGRGFDRIVFFMTKESRDKHYGMLVEELRARCGIDPERIVGLECFSTENQDVNAQWEWFIRLLDIIRDDDEVVFDFTHGFRSVPIIFATAISFLQTVRRFVLEHAYYGFVDMGVKTAEGWIRGRIVDMASFFRIARWADAASRLVDTADAGLLADLAGEGKDAGFAALSDPELVEALRDLTAIIKNVDVHGVAGQADKALRIVQARQATAAGAEACLLRMVADKFGELGAHGPGNGRYDGAYFQTQCILAQMLIEHGFLMQAFTVLRECIGSIGMAGLSGVYATKVMDSSDGRKYRRRFAERFVELCATSRAEWRWTDSSRVISDQDLKDFHQVEPFYAKIEAAGLILGLQSLTERIRNMRNGFDHAWTSKSGVPADAAEQASTCLADLQALLQSLRDARLME